MARGRKVNVNSARNQKLIAKMHREQKAMDSIIQGLEIGMKHYTKPYDLMISIYAQLIGDGYQIIPRPRRKDTKNA